MTIDYVITKEILGRPPVLDISKAQYLQLQAGYNTLIDALALEEKFELLMRNYSGLEGKSAPGVTAFRRDDEKLSDGIPLIVKIDDLRMTLEKKNVKAINLSKRCITNAVRS